MATTSIETLISAVLSGRSNLLRLTLLWATILSIAGCATSPFSKSIRATTEKQPSFSEISARPDAYKGRTVMLGGVIVQTSNLPNVTEIEVLQKSLDSSDRPEDVDVSAGRFLIRCQGFLDSAVYAKGREVTVAGEVKGKETKPLDQINYAYPVIGCNEIHLWATRPTYTYYPSPYYYDPWWRGWPGYYPYWYPYW
ncbi:Slp family lipoprotein [Methylocaldum sp.]|uniref:Slp family lipoprotein n=1 Tax=Methylocaldum sp. TaxID=1969727 RepID=UPI002D53FE58|nr:Slp family lipoprotein [Methylocaldum sp.]HYE38107.1 Slp family lipoprotein [Methylocaldum sp.]